MQMPRLHWACYFTPLFKTVYKEQKKKPLLELYAIEKSPSRE